MILSNAQTVSEVFEQRRGQSLGHDICNLMLCWNLQNAELSESNTFPDEVNVQLHVLSPTMVNWILRQINSRYIVVVDHRGLVDLDVELSKQVAQPTAFCSRVRHTPDSASALERDTVGCRLDDHEMSDSPR